MPDNKGIEAPLTTPKFNDRGIFSKVSATDSAAAASTDTAGSAVATGSSDFSITAGNARAAAASANAHASDAGSPSMTSLPQPQITIIVDGLSLYKPGMKTFFVEEGTDKKGSISSDGVVSGEFCTCDVVYTSVPSNKVVCVCDSHCTCEHVCSCDKHAPACSCVSHTTCSCQGYSTCSCVNYTSSTCSCQSVSCGSPCACVPVH